jgi:phage tail P2-like protein
MIDLTPAARVAAVKDVAVSLLPISASPRERALLTAELARLSVHTPERIATIWNPATCPAALLPWLAWAVSVDVWDATWSEATKRAVIAAAPAVHRLKGTRVAVRRALDALRIRTDIVEWWETEPPGRCGTATVTAYVSAAFEDDGVILSERIQRLAIASIRAAKPKSRSIKYQLGVAFPDALGLSGALQDVALVDPTMDAVTAMPNARIGAHGNLDHISAIRRTAETPVPLVGSRAGLHGLIGNVQLLYFSMEAIS